MRTSSLKAKGRRLQNDIVIKLRAMFQPYLQDDDIKPAIMGQSGIDVLLSPRARKLIPWSIECKYQERWSVADYWKQTTENTLKDTKPLLLMRKNRHETLAVLRLEDFLELIRVKDKMKEDNNTEHLSNSQKPM